MAPGISVLLGWSHVVHDTGQPCRELGSGAAEGERLWGEMGCSSRGLEESMLTTAAGAAAWNARSLRREISGALITPQKGDR